jgi:hypothetical protein
MSRDPEEGVTTDPATLHKYLYAGGDPVNKMDPTGRDYTGVLTLDTGISVNPKVIAGLAVT